jgi:hypothetical protein
MKFILIPLLLFPSILLAQATLKGTIVNGNKEPLPLTNIVLLKKNTGTITNENGQFNLTIASPADSIKISNIAYYSKLVAISDLQNSDTIVLSENIKQLNEIVVSNLSNFKTETNLGFYDNSANGSFKLIPENQLALYIANRQAKEGWIKGVSFKVKDLGKCKNSMRIRLLQMDSVKFMPSIDILDENLIIKSADLKKLNYIDLSAYKIMLPKEGVFVVLEWLYPDKDCDRNLYTSLSATLTEPTNIVWFNFRDKAWSKDKRPRLPNGNYMTPIVGLRVAY